MQTINGRYQLHNKLGQGGMGIVHRATDRLTGEAVALKQVFLPIEQLMFHSRPAAQTREALRLALAHEFQTLAGLRHPHIISVLDYGFDESGQPFFTMSYLEGAQTIFAAANGRSVPEKVALILQTLEALAYLHRRGILHRDLKPDNVLVVGDTVRVLDFGLSSAKEQATESVGSWFYMAPEVLQGAPASEASDLYAVGVLAYRLFTGSYPFNLRSDDVIGEILEKEPDWEPLGGQMDLTAVLQKLLGKTPQARFPSAKAAAIALRQIVPAASQTAVSGAFAENQAIRESYLQAATFVGRDAEMQQLLQALHQARQGQGTAWLLGGESGVGKSRLLRELQTQAMVAGFMVLRGQAVADNGGLPYQIWREPLRHLLLTATEVDDATASTLLPLVPDIAHLLGRTVAPAPQLEEQAMQKRLFAAVVRLFEQQERPLLLLFEDLHWANESLAIFPHFTNHLHTWPLLILGTYRSDERPNLPQLLPNMQPMFLRRLPPTAVALLSQSMLGEAGKRPDLLTMLQKETEGNAFFLVELVRALAEEAGQLDAVGQMVLPQTLLPDGIQTIVARRLSRIPQTGHRLLQLTAVAGRELDLAVVRWLNHNQPFDSWLAVCAEAMVLEVQNGRWGFSHDKIREGILADLAPDTRRKSHEQVALALEALYATHQDYAAALAHHWQQADNPAKERFYAYAAGELAAKQYRNQEALAFLERAYTLTAAEDLAERLGCLLAQEKICYFLGDRTVQSDKLTVMVALAKRLGDSNLLAEVMFRRSIYSFVVGDIPQALNSTHIALEHAKIAGNLAVQGLANRSLGNVFTARGMVHEALHHFELSLALHQQEGDLLRIAISSINAGAISTHMGNHTRSCELLNQAVALLEQLDDQQYLSSCLSFRAYDNSRIGDVAAAQADAERAVALAESTNYKAGLGMGHLGLGMMAMARGELERARSLLDEAILRLQESGDHFYRGITLRTAGQLALQVQDYARAIEYYAASLQIFTAMGNPGEVAMNQMGLAMVALARGEAVTGYLTAVFDYLHTHPYFVATANPFTVYLQLYHCLTALGDGRATQMLVEAHTLLQNRAQQFVNPEQKEMYLTVLAEHREIAALYEEVAKA